MQNCVKRSFLYLSGNREFSKRAMLILYRKVFLKDLSVAI